MAKSPPKKPPTPPSPRARSRVKGAIDPLARSLADAVRQGHGIDQASTLDMSEEIAAPRGYVGTRNIAFDRALGSKLPLGRITEISGWPGAGKSTMLDQILAQVQADGGLAVLADTERTRNRAYMEQLGIDPASTIWIGGSTVETMFDEIETLTRKVAHLNATAWYEALVRAKVRVEKPKTYVHKVYDPRSTTGKPVASFTFSLWGRAQAAALMEYQTKAGLVPSSVRDTDTRLKLQPCILHTQDKDERKAALEAWKNGVPHPLVQAADRPIVIGWDSVAGTATEAEMEGDARKQHVATAAKVIRRNLRRLVQLIDDEAIGFVIVNQRYEKIQTGPASFGPKSETYGGGGIKYHTTVRIEATRVGMIHGPGADRKNDAPVGQVVRIKVQKNKMNNPHHTEDYALIYGRGADNAWAIYEDLKKRGIIRVAGGWSSFVDPSLGVEKSFHGWTDLANMMAEDPKLWASLSALYMQGRT